MSYLKRYRLPSFTITVRECTPTERATVEPSRDALTVEIKAKAPGGGGIVWCNAIGSPVCGSWDEARCARTAISFASNSCDLDDADPDRLWVESFGETLTNEAFNHVVLGKELRQ